jgi:hypothetical protein
MNTPKKRKIDPNNRPGRAFLLGRPMTRVERNRRCYLLKQARLNGRLKESSCDCGNKAFKIDHGYPICARCAELQTYHMRAEVVGIIKSSRKIWEAPIEPKPKSLRVRITEAFHKLIIDAHGHYELAI